MTLVIARPFNSTGPEFVLNDPGDTFYCATGIVVNVIGASGLYMKNNQQVAIIEGNVAGFNGVDVQAVTGCRIEVAETGVLSGNFGRAVSSLSTGLTVINKGFIIAAQQGLFLDSFSTTTFITVNNSGRIFANGDAIVGFGESIRLANTGTITSLDGRSFFGSELGDRVTNAGTMLGDTAQNGGLTLNLYLGSDLYEGNGGRVTGVVAGGGGADTLRGGALTDVFWGGNEADILLGRGGRDVLRGDDPGGPGFNDVFDYNAITESGPTATTRDLIVDFNLGNDRIDLSTIDANTGIAGNQTFALLARDLSPLHNGAVGTGKIGWYWIDNANNALDRTILKINNDADAAIEMQIELVGLKSLNGAPGVDFVF